MTDIGKGSADITADSTEMAEGGLGKEMDPWLPIVKHGQRNLALVKALAKENNGDAAHSLANTWEEGNVVQSQKEKRFLGLWRNPLRRKTNVTKYAKMKDKNQDLKLLVGEWSKLDTENEMLQTVFEEQKLRMDELSKFWTENLEQKCGSKADLVAGNRNGEVPELQNAQILLDELRERLLQAENENRDLKEKLSDVESGLRKGKESRLVYYFNVVISKLGKWKKKGVNEEREDCSALAGDDEFRAVMKYLNKEGCGKKTDNGPSQSAVAYQQVDEGDEVEELQDIN